MHPTVQAPVAETVGPNLFGLAVSRKRQKIPLAFGSRSNEFDPTREFHTLTCRADFIRPGSFQEKIKYLVSVWILPRIFAGTTAPKIHPFQARGSANPSIRNFPGPSAQSLVSPVASISTSSVTPGAASEGSILIIIVRTSSSSWCRQVPQ